MADPEGFEERRDHFKNNRVSKHLTNLAARAAIRGLSATSQKYCDLLDPALNVGFIEGAILGSAILCPVENSDDVTYEQAGAGRYIGYDFNRPAAFPKAHKKGRLELQTEGRLMFFRLDELLDKPIDEQTPVGALDLMDIDHFYSLDRASPEELVEVGILAPTTHEEAYRAAGLYDTYGEDLASRTVPEEQIYMVTPKGNTLVVLMRDSGDSTPKEDPEPTFAEVLGGIRVA